MFCKRVPILSKLGLFEGILRRCLRTKKRLSLFSGLKVFKPLTSPSKKGTAFSVLLMLFKAVGVNAF